jgi:hypothetical protein
MTTSPMTYNQLNTYLQTLIQDQSPSADYTTILPAVIQDAEQRIYLDMDFVNTRTTWASTSFTPGTRKYVFPTTPSVVMVVQGVAAISPPTAATPALGTRNQLEPVSLDYIDSTWPQESMTGLPDSWAMFDDASIVVKPTPDQAYKVEITGTFRPNPMSVSNQTTYIGNVYPNLLVDACMIFLMGYQRDFGAQSDNPQMALSWKSMYDAALKTALAEEQRRKGQGTGWAPFSETPLATPPRT